MTNQNKAAQAAMQSILTAKERHRLLIRANYPHLQEEPRAYLVKITEELVLSKLRAEGVQAGGTADEARDDIAAGLQDSAYCAGLRRGFMIGEHGDHEGLRKALESRDGYVKAIRDARAALAAQKQGDSDA
ncbi:hypothetical protein [Achromobacter marplatensis]|uniref:hypothetical protein n=1 Tax=Achromobacter marplatensis TaxID=470868 RepID=UPI0028E61DF7|nr:hypothetical protein [Achromobacter marplatensis]